MRPPPFPVQHELSLYSSTMRFQRPGGISIAAGTVHIHSMATDGKAAAKSKVTRMGLEASAAPAAPCARAQAFLLVCLSVAPRFSGLSSGRTEAVRHCTLSGIRHLQWSHATEGMPASERGSKRLAVDDNADDPMDGISGAVEPVPLAVADLVAEVHRKISAEVAQSHSRCATVFTEALRSADIAYQARFAAQDSEIADIKRRLVAVEQHRTVQESTNKKLADGLALASSSPAEVPTFSADFEREIDPCLVRIRTMEATTLEYISGLLSELLCEASMSLDDVDVEGLEPGKQFSVRFTGASGLAARRAGKFLSLQRTSTGWRDFFVRAAGSSPDAPKVQVFFDTDKNPKQVRREMVGRKLAKIIRQSGTTERVTHKKKDGVIALGFVPLAKIATDNPEHYKVEWNLELLRTKGLDRASWESQLEQEMAGPGASISWG